MKDYSYIGKGKVFLARRSDDKDKLRFVGNCEKVDLSLNEETKELKDFTQAGGGVANSVSRIDKLEISLNLYDGWEYAQKQLSTIPFSLDLDKSNQFQLTPWEAKEKSDFVFSEDDILYQSIQVQLANRREIQNKGNLTFQYRYQRFKQQYP